MICIENPFSSCYLNIASEEYYMTSFSEDIFYLYINDPSIIVGANQNAYAEINQPFVQTNEIAVVRRLSGGGAVYHDRGNLNYGFITKAADRDIAQVFREHTAPILDVLRSLGADASFSGRNDLVIDDRKVSGIAQYHAKGKLLLHGTLLFDSDLDRVAMALNADPRKFSDKGIKSVRSRVANISACLREPMTIDAFAGAIMAHMLKTRPGAVRYVLSEQDKTAIRELADAKYATFNWVFGNSPAFTYQNSLKYDFGLLEIGLAIGSGVIEEARFYGDFFGTRPVLELAGCLAGLPFDRDSIEHALLNVEIGDYIYGLSNERFIDSLFDGDGQRNNFA